MFLFHVFFYNNTCVHTHTHTHTLTHTRLGAHAGTARPSGFRGLDCLPPRALESPRSSLSRHRRVGFSLAPSRQRPHSHSIKYTIHMYTLTLTHSLTLTHTHTHTHTQNGETPGAKAKRNGSREVEALLRQHGGH
jgi:hypothetical protein